MCSCASTKNVTYFKDVPDTLVTPYVIQKTKFEEPKIKSGDVLNITIQTLDPRAVAMISGSTATNGPATTTTGQNGMMMPGAVGYLVDQRGFVELPLVGRVKIAGLTVSEARDSLHDRAQLYYNDPIVNVRPNFMITVFGDVNRPGTYTIASNKVSVLDAISAAGDLNISGKRENILLLRDDGGGQVVASRFNINNSAELFSNPNYYLLSGDKLYIEPNKAKKKSATVDFTKDRYLTYSISFLSLLVAFASLYR